MCSALFQLVFFMKFIYNLQNMYIACVSTGKLTLVNDTDLIAGDHAAFTFQGGVGNIKYIGSAVRVKNKLASRKILQGTGKFIHIDTVFCFSFSCDVR